MIKKKGILFWITGLSGSGKTTLAKKLFPHILKNCGPSIHLDGDTLRSEAAGEKENLITQLREDLEASSRRNLLERQKEEAEFMGDTMNKIPYGIYIG